MKGLRSPEGLARIDPGGAGLNATLRPYQQAGVRWLYLLNRLGLGACLADDMGLGKTIQVLALLLVLKRESEQGRLKRSPSVLVAPASLLANWSAEVERFAPTLSVLVAHPSAMSASDLKAVGPEQLANVDLVITSYGATLRYPWLSNTAWRVAVLDEAQAIKNPGAQQTRAVKKLSAQTRIALTGTPVENRLSDLWSIFDFTHSGLLGSDKTVLGLCETAVERGEFRAAAGSRAAVHSAPAEDRQNRDRRSAGQDRDEGLLSPESQASRPLSTRRRGAAEALDEAEGMSAAKASFSRS